MKGLIIAIALFVLAFLHYSVITVVPPEAVTDKRLMILEERIIAYVKQVGSPPRTLRELPSIPGKDNKILDGWNHDIIYRCSGSTIILTSYGKDGVPGGVGSNADMVSKFVWQ